MSTIDLPLLIYPLFQKRIPRSDPSCSKRYETQVKHHPHTKISAHLWLFYSKSSHIRELWFLCKWSQYVSLLTGVSLSEPHTNVYSGTISLHVHTYVHLYARTNVRTSVCPYIPHIRYMTNIHMLFSQQV